MINGLAYGAMAVVALAMGFKYLTEPRYFDKRWWGKMLLITVVAGAVLLGLEAIFDLDEKIAVLVESLKQWIAANSAT